MTESNLVQHARRELALAGEEPEMTESLIRAVEGIASFPGHSGGSMMVAIATLNRLLSFQNLAPLTDDPEEWFDRSIASGVPLWQSKRSSDAFSDDGGKTYWLLSDGASSANPRPRHTSVPSPHE